jgi:hypothetical protein
VVNRLVERAQSIERFGSELRLNRLGIIVVKLVVNCPAVHLGYQRPKMLSEEGVQVIADFRTGRAFQEPELHQPIQGAAQLSWFAKPPLGELTVIDEQLLDPCPSYRLAEVRQDAHDPKLFGREVGIIPMENSPELSLLFVP